MMTAAAAMTLLTTPRSAWPALKKPSARGGGGGGGCRRTSKCAAPSSSAATSAPAPAVTVPGVGAAPGWRVALTTMPATRPTLGVSVWPDFDYDASGAGDTFRTHRSINTFTSRLLPDLFSLHCFLSSCKLTVGTVFDVVVCMHTRDDPAWEATTLGVVGEPDPSRVDARGNPLVHLCFDVATFEGPPVMGSTTRVFGVPLPPGIRIDIVPLSLEGWLDTSSGACSIDFDAEFRGGGPDAQVCEWNDPP
jgi:hypothetical protein